VKIYPTKVLFKLISVFILNSFYKLQDIAKQVVTILFFTGNKQKKHKKLAVSEKLRIFAD